MKYLFFFLFTLNASAATKQSECGMYDVFGTFKKNEQTKSYDFLVNAGSISQYTYKLSEIQERLITPYIGHSVKVRALILSETPDYHGKFDKIEKVDFSVPDPANFNGLGGFTLVKKEKCR